MDVVLIGTDIPLLQVEVEIGATLDEDLGAALNRGDARDLPTVGETLDQAIAGVAVREVENIGRTECLLAVLRQDAPEVVLGVRAADCVEENGVIHS